MLQLVAVPPEIWRSCPDVLTQFTVALGSFTCRETPANGGSDRYVSWQHFAVTCRLGREGVSASSRDTPSKFEVFCGTLNGAFSEPCAGVATWWRAPGSKYHNRHEGRSCRRRRCPMRQKEAFYPIKLWAGLIFRDNKPISTSRHCYLSAFFPAIKQRFNLFHTKPLTRLIQNPIKAAEIF